MNPAEHPPLFMVCALFVFILLFFIVECIDFIIMSLASLGTFEGKGRALLFLTNKHLIFLKGFLPHLIPEGHEAVNDSTI